MNYFKAKLHVSGMALRLSKKSCIQGLICTVSMEIGIEIRKKQFGMTFREGCSLSGLLCSPVFLGYLMLRVGTYGLCCVNCGVTRKSLHH